MLSLKNISGPIGALVRNRSHCADPNNTPGSIRGGRRRLQATATLDDIAKHRLLSFPGGSFPSAHARI